ncbi:Cdc6-like protein [Encephalitozoon hellem ATCC 50504]|uniref:Cell division control protein 6-like protein n=1 Tax=Encephalitozoon hellem TaxID=27973 RepID=A0A9Q9C2A0_ENCHE|nr:Cdc6-like protein [Encephalitozoon hellem ATCC 50504]AFM97990.1 Cdc6-like protein [Encephalitozoon hellem ATCC 50504]UTX42794.1 cell division control protein 6-like protein [Encephalitozoon hellem]WEL38253.1 origin recognition complex subunit 1 [Encephalitozoon hellem]|eukprot:XP_003886971.1 Cdc6-like protein [Encephalitozoon hellem ATCC 50504]
MVVLGREEEYLKLERYLDIFLSTGAGGIVYISGVPGAGKTHTVLELMERRQVSHLFLNATELRSKREVYRWVLTNLSCNSSQKKMYLMNLQRHFMECALPHVIVIDEVDTLIGKSQEILYNIFDMPYLRNSKLLLFVISNTMNLPEKLFEPKVCSRIGGRRVNFVPYTSAQLCSIANGCGMKRKCVELISKRIGAISGDARKVRDVIDRVKESEKGNDAEILDVDGIMRKMYVPVYTYCIQGLSFYQKVILFLLNGSGRERMKVNELYEEFISFCKRSDIEEIGFFEYLDLVGGLTRCGILRCMNSGKEVLAMVLREEVEKSLEGDKEYLEMSGKGCGRRLYGRVSG